jgi:hypothetical protein
MDPRSRGSERNLSHWARSNVDVGGTRYTRSRNNCWNTCAPGVAVTTGTEILLSLVVACGRDV